MSDDIRDMARQASLDWHANWDGDGNRLEAFAALVAAAEREACAKVCEEVDATTGECPELAKYCADAIRKRGAL